MYRFREADLCAYFPSCYSSRSGLLKNSEKGQFLSLRKKVFFKDLIICKTQCVQTWCHYILSSCKLYRWFIIVPLVIKPLPFLVTSEWPPVSSTHWAVVSNPEKSETKNFYCNCFFFFGMDEASEDFFS